jgi:hypothetical protein
MYLTTVDWAISMPSLSSSPWMRGAPHRGFSRLIRRTRLPMLADRAGRPAPRRDFQRQNRRKPVRCQRSRVSGLKMIDASSREGEQAIEADEDQAIYGFQLRSGWCCPVQDDELLPQVKDLSITPRVRAVQPRDQHAEKSQNNDHPGGSLSDWNVVDRLDEIFSRDTTRQPGLPPRRGGQG